MRYADGMKRAVVQHIMIVSLLVLGLSAASIAYAEGDGGGDAGGGADGGGDAGGWKSGGVQNPGGGAVQNSGRELVLRLYPNVDREIATKIYGWLLTLREDQLTVLSLTDRVCDLVECNGLEPTVVRQLSAEALNTIRREQSDRANWLRTGVATAIALVALLLSFLSYRHARRKDANG